MKILVITDHFPPDVEGGYELRCEEACNWLHKKKYKIRVLTIENEKIKNNHNYDVKRILKKYPNGSTPKDWNIITRFFNAVRDNYIFRKEVSYFKPDYLYLWRCQGISRSLIPEIFNTTIQTKLDMGDTWLRKVSNEHGPIYGFLQRETESKWKEFLKYIILKLLPFLSLGFLRKNYHVNIKLTDGVFCSTYLKNHHLKNNIKCSHFEVINTGVDHKLFFSRKKIINNNNELNLLFIGAHTKDKGIFILYEQLKNIRSCINKNITLNMVGNFLDEKEKIKFIKLIKDLPENIKIQLNGQVDRSLLKNYYYNAHFTILSSIWDEPFSRVPLESMACGTPCIAIRNPGLNDLLEAEAPLILFEKQDVRSLGKAIQPYSDLDNNYSILCDNCSIFVDNNYTFDKYMEKISVKFFQAST